MTPEQLCRKAEFLYQQYILRKKSVEGVVGQYNSSKDVLTEKQRARVVEVRSMLEKGVNPFTKEELDSNNKVSVIGAASFVRVESQERIAALEKKWGQRPEIFVKPVYELDDVDLGFIPVTPDDGKLRCSYCGVVVDEINATRGTGDPSIKFMHTLNVYTDDQGDPSIIEKESMKVTAVKLVACPDHALNITKGSARFPYSEG